LIDLKVLADVIGKEIISEQLLPLILKMSSDPVPNVRFNVCKTLKLLIPLLDPTAVQVISSI
jgi:serine/threonine-protein phosphatase 2A regulatory subunit A